MATGSPFTPHDALCLALGFLGTDPAADRREGVVPPQDPGGRGELSGGQGGDELGDGDPHRAPGHAGTVLALDAALRLADCRVSRAAG